jgi:hypothetical protein
LCDLHRKFDNCKSCSESASKGYERCTFLPAFRPAEALHFSGGVYIQSGIRDFRAAEVPECQTGQAFEMFQSGIRDF